MHPVFENYFRFIKRLMPSQGSSGVIGIDLNAPFCRAVELSRKGEAMEMVRAVEFLVDNGDEKGALMKVLAACEFMPKPKPVVACVNGRGTLIRYIDMPRMGVQDLRRAFAIEADKYFPFPKETIYTDCHILDPKSTDKKMPVLVAAAKKDMVDARIKLFKDAGVDLDLVGLAPAGIANAFAAFPPQIFVKDGGQGRVAKAVAVLDIGENGSNLMIIVDGKPCFSRDIYIGLAEIVKRVANVAGVGVVEARALLFSPGEKPEPVTKSVEAVLSNLASEVLLSFDYFVTERNTLIAQMCLVGDAVDAAGVETFLATKFEVPLVAWNPLEKVPAAVGVKREEIAARGRKFVTALGMALQVYDQA